MTTNYPTSIDTFVNPTSNDSLNSPSHSQQHANLNDAMIAVQTKLGAGNANKVGEYLVSSGTFSSAANLTVDNCFTSSYDNYKIYFQITSKTTSGQNAFALRASGSTIGGTGYRFQSLRSYSTTVDTYPYSGGTSEVAANAAVGNGQMAHWVWTVMNPALAQQTSFIANWFAYDGGNFVHGLTQGHEATSAARDGFIITTATGTMTGTYRVYGLRNS